MSDSENQGATEHWKWHWDTKQGMFKKRNPAAPNMVDILNPGQMERVVNQLEAQHRDLEATITTLKAQVSRKEEEWREAEKEVQFYAGRNADLISENLTLKAQLEAAEEAIRAQPRIQHLQQFPHIKPNQWEQLLLDALSAPSSDTGSEEGNDAARD